MLALAGCASKSAHTADVWADAALVGGQAAAISEQRRTLDDLGAALGAIQSDLNGARTDLDRALGETQDLRELFGAIDAFVRAVIDAERRLEELQQSDRGADVPAGP
jgi:hypothetical protein